jgi:hypothetical protein
MPTRAQVLALLDEGQSFPSAARALGIAPGKAFMIATGLPADRSDTPHPEEVRGAPVPSGSTQDLVNPATRNPTRDATVAAWVAARAARELRRDA